ncbi:TonB-dependent receptor [Thalassotalea sp. G2M2-11]|uniref:TonB-dependent receptor n=1 Tax=Thalassotalea sp. G2M2-11 TaxID=2787627 RepID=UPI0019CFFE88
MKHTRVKKSVLAVQSALLLSIGLTGQVWAEEQKQQKEKKKAEEVEVIEVTGYRGSVQKSLNIKRFADTIVDAVSAEDIGKFPDQTVADALQRITGVQVEKSEGESNRVSIRGTAPHLNLTLLNGQNVASATASHSILKASRGFNYSLLPTEIINTLEVHKSAQAKVQEGSVGGTVIVKTRLPLNEKANTAVFSLKDSYQETSGEHSPTYSGYYTWKNNNENFGFNIGGVVKESTTQRDGYSSIGYEHSFSHDGQTVYTPFDVSASRYKSDKELTTLSSALQFEITDGVVLTLNNLLSSVDKANRSTSNGVYIGSKDPAKSGLTGTLTGDILTSGSIFANLSDIKTQPDRYHHTQDYLESRYALTQEIGSYETKVHDLRLDWAGDNFDLAMQVGITKAEGDISIQALDYEAPTDATFDVSGNSLNYSLTSNPQPEDYVGTYMADKLFVNDQEETYFQTDLHYQLDHDFINSFDVGIKYMDHSKSSQIFLEIKYPWLSYEEPWSGSAWLGSIYPGMGVQSINMGGMTNGLADNFMGEGTHPHLFNYNFSNLLGEFDKVTTLRDYNHLGYSLALEEKISSAYAQVNFESGKLKGNAGIRVAKTKQASIGVDILTPAGWYKPDVLFDTAVPVTVERDYTDVLPSLNLSYRVQDDIIVRVAAAKVIARPDYDLLAQRKIYSRAGGVQGNPMLDPTKATQYDISAEYYFTEASILSFAYFIKNIETYVDTDNVLAKVLLPADESVNEFGVDGVAYEVTEMELRTPVNGSGGTNKGFEINAQHDFNNGFGLLANYTYQKADMDEEDAVLPNNSKDTFNMSGYYEVKDFSARVSYTFRSSYYAGLARNIDRYTDDYGQWDANFNYHLNDNISFNLQILNFTDENQEYYVKSETGATARLAEYNYGRRIFAGVSAKF